MAGGPGNKPLTSSVFYVLLGLSAGPRHGLGIAEEIQTRTGRSTLLGPGSLYTALKKALVEGLIEEAPPPDEGQSDPRRRHYAITALGRRRIGEETATLDRVVAIAKDLNVAGEVDS